MVVNRTTMDMLPLGHPDNTGSIVSYFYDITNSNPFTGLLMVVLEVRLPSCLTVDFPYLDAIHAAGLIDYYEV